MSDQQRRDAAVGALRFVPAKWAIAIVAALIVYALLQPRVNQWWGWNLPSLGAMLGEESPKSKADKGNKEGDKKNSSKEETDQSDRSSKSKSTNTKSTDAKSGKAGSKSGKSTKNNADRSSDEQDDEANEEDLVDSTSNTDKKSGSDKPTANSGKTGAVSSKPSKSDTARSSDKDSDKEFDYLTPVGRNRFKSPAGLIYGPGSEEGHRLKHIERHLTDQPNRPGSHGVFDGDMHDFLVAIDDAYTRAKKKEKGTKMIDEDDSVVYEASFAKPIGFQGGMEGARKKRPKITHLRVVVRGESVITAFPF